MNRTRGQRWNEDERKQPKHSKSAKQINKRGRGRPAANSISLLCCVIIPGVPAAGLEQVADSIVLGIPGDQRRSLGGEVVGGDALQARDF